MSISSITGVSYFRSCVATTAVLRIAKPNKVVCDATTTAYNIRSSFVIPLLLVYAKKVRWRCFSAHYYPSSQSIPPRSSQDIALYYTSGEHQAKQSSSVLSKVTHHRVVWHRPSKQPPTGWQNFNQSSIFASPSVGCRERVIATSQTPTSMDLLSRHLVLQHAGRCVASGILRAKTKFVHLLQSGTNWEKKVIKLRWSRTTSSW